MHIYIYINAYIYIYIYMYIYIYIQSGHNQANTTCFVLKLKHPLRNTCSGQKNCRI